MVICMVVDAKQWQWVGFLRIAIGGFVGCQRWKRPKMGGEWFQCFRLRERGEEKKMKEMEERDMTCTLTTLSKF